MDAYWAKVSEEIGEPVLMYGLGKYLSGREDPGPLWGILYHSASTFYFRHFAQQSWFSSILTTANTDNPGSARNREILYTIPLSHIRTVESEQEGSWVQRLLSPSSPVVSLIPVFESTPSFRFTLENNRTSFLASLYAALNGKI